MALSGGVVVATLSVRVTAASTGIVTDVMSGVVTTGTSGVVMARVNTTRVSKKSAPSVVFPATSEDADGFVLVGARKERREKHKIPTAVIGTRTGPNEVEGRREGRSTRYQQL